MGVGVSLGPPAGSGLNRKGRRAAFFLVEEGATQRTGKLWKLIQAIGVMGLIVAAVLFFISMGDATRDPSARQRGATAAAIGIVSLPVWLFGRLGAWWFHG